MELNASAHYAFIHSGVQTQNKKLQIHFLVISFFFRSDAFFSGMCVCVQVYMCMPFYIVFMGSVQFSQLIENDWEWDGLYCVCTFFSLSLFVLCAVVTFIPHLDLSTLYTIYFFCYWNLLFFFLYFSPLLVHFLSLSNSILFNNTLFTQYLNGRKVNMRCCMHSMRDQKTAENVKHKFFAVDFLTLETARVQRTGDQGAQEKKKEKKKNYINICVIWKLCLLCSGNRYSALFRRKCANVLCKTYRISFSHLVALPVTTFFSLFLCVLLPFLASSLPRSLCDFGFCDRFNRKTCEQQKKKKEHCMHENVRIHFKLPI